jgi:2-amino-4-hydroxy-6-hydroxymethyldihydropteridine diphosphokinase
LRRAREHIVLSAGTILESSHVYLTEAWGKVGQPDFYNQVLKISTGLNALDLLKTLLKTEKDLGRTRQVKWEPRIIDIDILFYNQEIQHNQTLQLPHPLIPKRNFVIVPLLEICPDLIHPILEKTIEELYLESDDPLEVLMIENHG